MRPRKTILVCSDNEQRISLLNYMLEINRYRPLSALGVDCAFGYLRSEREINLVVVLPPFRGAAKVLEKASFRHPGTVRLVIADRQYIAEEACLCGFADVALVDPKAADLLERMKVWTGRKPGPKKSIPVVDEEMAPACSA